jgi:formate C-acetyltransferase
MCPTVLVSCFVDNCLEKGMDVRRGGAKYNTISPNAVGLANIGDSLAVIKQKVYDENKYSLTEMKHILDQNYDNYEDVRQEFINTVPKYGNDEPYVDQLVKQVGSDFCVEMKKIKSNRNGFFSPALQSSSTHVAFIGTIGATPDGRTKEMLLSDGGVSAAQGRDRKGVTALIKSVASIDHARATSGTLLNVKFSPATLEGDRGTGNMIALIRSYFSMKGQHIQFNIVNTKTLRAAQKDPDKYRDLVVRVAGFSVYFAEVDKMLQNDIIERMEQVI